MNKYNQKKQIKDTDPKELCVVQNFLLKKTSPCDLSEGTYIRYNKFQNDDGLSRGIHESFILYQDKQRRQKKAHHIILNHKNFTKIILEAANSLNWEVEYRRRKSGIIILGICLK